MIPKTQAPSQGAGQTLPVNSGKLLVYKSHFFYKSEVSQKKCFENIFKDSILIKNECK